MEQINVPQFSMEAFAAGFEKNLKALQKAEKITKDLLRDMSRDVLNAVHVTQDSGVINKLIAVLTPVNRKVAILFYKEFSGFNWDDEEVSFGKKNKKKYEDIKAKALLALTNPHFNIWTWAERNVDIEKKPLKLADITKFVEKTLKRANEEGIAQADVIKAIIDGGLELDALMALMDAAVQEEQEQPE